MLYTFETVPPELRRTDEWPVIEIEALDDADRERFLRLKRGIEHGLASGNVTAAAKEAGCSRTTLQRQLNRCLERDPRGGLVGWYALKRGARVKAYLRSAPLPQGRFGDPAAVARGAGLFQMFLRTHPGLQSELDAEIRKKAKTHNFALSKQTKAALSTFFKKLCKRQDVSDASYPLNTRARAAKSLARYVESYLMAHPGAIASWYGDEAAGHVGLGGGSERIDFARRATDVATLDAHCIDCLFTIVVDTPSGPQPMVVNRIWIYALCSFNPPVLWSIAASFGDQPSSSVVLEMLMAARTPWQPKDVASIGLHYKDGAGYPHGSIEGLGPPNFDLVLVDNALQHFASRILSAFRRMGATVEFCAVGQWAQRAIGERLFGTLEVRGGLQRLPNGMAKFDGKPTVAPAERALATGARWNDALLILDVIGANYNAEAHKRLGNRSPLEAMRASRTFSAEQWFYRPTPPASFLRAEIGMTVMRRPFAGNLKRGERPYVEIDKLRYSHRDIDWSLIGTAGIFHYPEGDGTWLRAFDESGKEIGVLRATGPTASFKCSRALRKILNNLISQGELDGDSDDIARDYALYLQRAAAASSEGKDSPKVNAPASQMAEVLRIVGRTAVPAAPREGPKLVVVTPRPYGARKPDWGSNGA